MRDELCLIPRAIFIGKVVFYLAGAREGTSDPKCLVSKGMKIDFYKVCLLTHHLNDLFQKM